MSDMDGNERRALDAIARDAGIEGKGSHLDLGFVYPIGIQNAVRKLIASCEGAIMQLSGSGPAKSLDDQKFAEAERRCMDSERKVAASACFRDVAIAIKPHVAALHALLQTIEPKEEV